MWSLSDESLLAGLASGDEAVAAMFIRRFQGRVFGLAAAIVGEAAAEDVAQEAFVRAWRHAGSYDPRRGRVATWLLAITRNIAIDTLRVRRADPVDAEAFARLQAHGPSVDPEERGVVAAESSRLSAALRALPEEQKRALLLAAFYGRTAREISESENVALGTVKTRVRTAMLKLRSALEVSDEP
jgi:RNA polymerase sigma factor (sigma-70 family)